MLRVCSFEIEPLADESLGVRSMSILVTTPDVVILLDPGVSLAPRRFNLPPHPEEFRALAEARKRIVDRSQEAEILVISHYHRDHFTPPYESLYECCSDDDFVAIYSRRKKLLLKALDSKTPFNQKKRAWLLTKAFEKLGVKAEQVGEGSTSFGETTLSFFSSSHGSSKLGNVLVVTLRYRDECTLIFAPDVQGPVDDAAFSRMLSTRFDIAFVGGPPLYLQERSEELTSIARRGLANLAALVKANPRRVVVSHHLLRAPDWVEALEQYGVDEDNVLTYSSIRGSPLTLLEANRKLLFESDPPPHGYENLLAKYKGRKCTQLLHEL
uniref:UPF0282 protein ENM88_02630 n=1 Tax=Thermofilum pendens TaxID=2269 RepID=A0A7J3X679_THEPE